MEAMLRTICQRFEVEGEMKGWQEITNGNINGTYRVDFAQPDAVVKSCILQRVNVYVFNRPRQVMENIDRVTRHIREKGGSTLRFYNAHDGRNYCFDDEGNFWRLQDFVPSVTYNTCDDLFVVRGAGEAFGEFQMLLSDFDAAKLHTTIDDFHNTQARYDRFRQVVREDPCGLSHEVRAEIEWLLENEETACRLCRLFNEGQLPLRVTHNDTKINNVLFDKQTRRPLVVIDLDTVMPGLVGHDFGDAIRTAGNPVAEDSPEWEKAQIRLDVFRAFAEGFLSRTARSLTQAETDTLALSCFVLATEQAVRFLDDYLRGSPYYKIRYPEHNLVRTRCQIAYAKDILRHLDEMTAIVRELAAKEWP